MDLFTTGRRRIAAAALLLVLPACTQGAPAPGAPPALPAAEGAASPAAAEAAGAPPAPSAAATTTPDAHGGHPQPEDPADTGTEASPQVDVSMVDIAFEPTRLELVAGEPVTLTVSNDGAIEHDLDLPAADLHVHAQPGDQQTTTLQIDTPGTYEAQCLLPGHAAAGMVLEVIVR